MVSIPNEVMELLNDPKVVKALSTNGEDGLHTVVLGSIIAPSPDMIAFGAILMKRSSTNLESMKAKGEEVSIIVAKELAAYEIKGKIGDFVTAGPLFDGMNENLKKMGMQARGVWTVMPTGIWNQGASYEAGNKIA